MRAGEFMTPSPVTAQTDTTVREALEMMREFDIRHMPVLDEEALVGIISDRDLRSFLPPTDDDWGAPDPTDPRFDAPVSAAMQAHVVAVSSDATMKEVIDQLVDWRIGAVAVTDPGDDSLVGIISYVDVLEVLRDRSV